MEVAADVLVQTDTSFAHALVDPQTVQAFMAEEKTLREIEEAKRMQTQDMAITLINQNWSTA